jgi:hypothetical protein
MTDFEKKLKINNLNKINIKRSNSGSSRLIDVWISAMD